MMMIRICIVISPCLWVSPTPSVSSLHVFGTEKNHIVMYKTILLLCTFILSFKGNKLQNIFITENVVPLFGL